MRNFLDTNILVYADANDEPKKQDIAIAIIRENLLANSGVISTQVLQEYANVALRKLGLSAELVAERIKFYSNFEVVITSPELLISAIGLYDTRKTSFYDALIIGAAINSSCDTLLSEDLQGGAVFGTTNVENPFKHK